jgi:hypothetical protein
MRREFAHANQTHVGRGRPRTIALLLEIFDEIVADLDLRTEAHREKAAKIVVRLAHGQKDFDAEKIRVEVVRLISSVNVRWPWIPSGKKAIAPTKRLDQHKPVEQMTWAPGEPLLIRDRLIADTGWIDRQGVSVFNLYRPPTIERGDPSKAGRHIGETPIRLAKSTSRMRS